MIVQMKLAGRRSTQVAAVAESLLMSSSHRPLRTIFCTYDDGQLVLEGRVNTFFHKQLAQEMVANVDGVRQVVNKIEVANRTK